MACLLHVVGFWLQVRLSMDVFERGPTAATHDAAQSSESEKRQREARTFS